VAEETERILLDTNVLLSAVLFGGKPERLFEAVRSGRASAVTSLHILREFQDVLTSPRFGISARVAEELAVEMASFMEVVPVGPPRGRWVSDPKDDPIVEAALRGEATVIVTGDRRLLQAEVPGLRVITVAEMVTRLEP
jgi:putative PIN family toxin of toxin-antitoxin system